MMTLTDLFITHARDILFVALLLLLALYLLKSSLPKWLFIPLLILACLFMPVPGFGYLRHLILPLAVSLLPLLLVFLGIRIIIASGRRKGTRP